MNALKNATLVICILALAALMTILFIAPWDRGSSNEWINGFLWIGGIILFYILLLWIPHRFRENKRIRVIRWIAFLLSLLPIIAFFKIISRIQC